MPDANKSREPEFYKLNVGRLPDALYQPDVPVERWLETDCFESTGTEFPPHSLSQTQDIEWDVELERMTGIALYMMMNVLPFLLVPLWALYSWGPAPWAQRFVLGLWGYTLTLALLEYFVWQPHFLRKYQQMGYLRPEAHTDYRGNQYVFTERNTTKYMSTSYVWPKSLYSKNVKRKDRPLLFCMVPHGVAPFGITAYPLWSKLWNVRLCRWTVAPVVLKIPLVGYLIQKIGYIPAQQSAILEALTKREENVGVILDGIAGMFHPNSSRYETLHLKNRKGIIKIALKAGVSIVPVYGFGHTAAYTVLVDPFGILERLSNALQTSLTPFWGRWGWLLGPPRRVPITVCLGNPVQCPQVDNPTQEQIDKYHSQLLRHYEEVFDQHKGAYGWKNKTLKFV